MVNDNEKMIPGTKSAELHKRRLEEVPRGPYNITEVYIESAKGAKLKDVDGNEYIDFAGGIGMQNVGHNHPKVVKAVKNQVDKAIHTCFHVAPYESYIELASRLNELTPGHFKKKTMFANSGAEAVENAVKIVRKHTGRPGVISFDRGYHGRTLLTMSLTSKVRPYKLGFGPFAPSVYRLPYPYYYRAENGMSEAQVDDMILKEFQSFFVGEVDAAEIGAVILEPVQGEGGFIVPSKNFVQGVKSICEDNGILFIADEIQTGFGRTGKLFAMENFDVAPDLTTLSKSLAAGMPLSAVTGRADVMDASEQGQLGGTFSGSPVSCAAGLAVLDVLQEEDLIERGQLIGKRIQDKMNGLKEKFELIGDVRGIGAMWAVELVKDRQTKEPAKEEAAQIVKACWQNGLFALSAGTYGNVLRFLPPLVIQNSELEEGLTILEKAIEQAAVNKVLV
ncbi:MAG TPA: 4-aminobutyrate--2-oxoglutarate transaminase [Bacillus sp. (in: firmicutes)]|nr:4-aminobutyrate--2-oxoglutarate transaminase [Bacillus sp. (in: firmicutes)]